MVTVIRDVTGTAAEEWAEPVLQARRPGDPARVVASADHIRRSLGWRAEHGFESGLARTVDWFLDNEWWWRPLRERRYGGERLGLPGGSLGAEGGRP